MLEYNRIDQQLHLLSQVVAKANRFFVAKRVDDSHTNIYFDALDQRITGRWFQAGDKRLMLTLNLENLHVDLLDSSHQVLQSIQTVGKQMAEIDELTGRALSDFGLSAKEFSRKLHFQIPAYDIADRPVEPLNEKGMKEWMYYRQLANEACFHLLVCAQVWEEVRIWPHHFDTGIAPRFNENIQIGFGLAMEDEMAGSPYFYMAGYPAHGSLEYEGLPTGNHWRWEMGEQWKGAILPLSEIHHQSEADRSAVLLDFQGKAFRWFIKQ